MALEATHIRFALDIKDSYKIVNISEYIVGTIYPDSRYVSKIDRSLTHNEAVLSPGFAIDDFRAGWQAHQFCDVIQNQVFQKTIPGFADLDRITNHDEWWTAFTAGKIIADMKDAQSFSIESALKSLNLNLCPNGESFSSIIEYRQIISDLYKGKAVPRIEDYVTMWNKFGVNNKLVDRVQAMTKHLLDSNLDDVIWSCFDKMVEAARSDTNR